MSWRRIGYLAGALCWLLVGMSAMGWMVNNVSPYHWYIPPLVVLWWLAVVGPVAFAIIRAIRE